MYLGKLDELIQGEQRRIKNIKYPFEGDPTFLPIFLTGGIGDAILSIPTLRHLKKEGYELAVYSENVDAIRYFCADLPIHQGPQPNFTWCLHLDSVAKFKFSSRFGGFLLPEHKELFERQQRFFREHADMEYLITNYPKFKYALTETAKSVGLNSHNLPLYSLGFKDLPSPAPLVRTREAKKVFTIHDGFDLNSAASVSGRATKIWKWEHWNLLVRKLRCEYPDYEIIQVGSKTSRIIDGAHTNWVNRTTLSEAFDILSTACVHIDTDSGMAHAATALGVPCVVLFGPTPKSFYGHPDNKNLSSTKSCSGGCFHLTENWMDKCPIGYQEPECMNDISVNEVMKSVAEIMN